MNYLLCTFKRVQRAAKIKLSSKKRRRTVHYPHGCHKSPRGTDEAPKRRRKLYGEHVLMASAVVAADGPSHQGGAAADAQNVSSASSLVMEKLRRSVIGHGTQFDGPFGQGFGYHSSPRQNSHHKNGLTAAKYAPRNDLTPGSEQPYRRPQDDALRRLDRFRPRAGTRRGLRARRGAADVRKHAHHDERQRAAFHHGRGREPCLSKRCP